MQYRADTKRVVEYRCPDCGEQAETPAAQKLRELAAALRFLHCRPILAGTMFPINCSLITVPGDSLCRRAL